MTTFTDAWLPGPNSTQFYTRTYPAAVSPPRAVLVFLHGFIEHIARFERVHAAWAKRGITVFAFDQRGFGRTAVDCERRSAGSKYAKTSWREQLEDAEWAVKKVSEEYQGVPLYLMGHSMGGALALGFTTRPSAPPSPASVALLSGIIATSPLLIQTHPASKAARWVGGKVSVLAPALIIPAEVKAEYLSHDDAVNKAYLQDPLVKQVGSLRGISDMLDGGEQLVNKDYQRWPKDLPVLLIHGTDDQVTSPKATERFYNALSATDKHLSLYKGGYHELQNEPDGVRERLIEECIAWVEARVGGRLSISDEGPVGSKL